MKLYEITKEYETILDNMYDEEGNINQDALIKLDENKEVMEKKVIAVASYIKNLDAERHAIDEAKKDMATREKRYKKKIEDMEEYLKINMDKRGINHIACAYFDIKLKKNRVSVDDSQLNMGLLPDEYKRTKTIVEPDKIKILEEYAMGVVIPGVGYKQTLSLSIK